MCDALKVSQIIKILNLYTPADEYEERVSPSFVRKIQNKLQDRAAIETEQQVSWHRYWHIPILLYLPQKQFKGGKIQLLHFIEIFLGNATNGHEILLCCKVSILSVLNSAGRIGNTRSL